MTTSDDSRGPNQAKKPVVRVERRRPSGDSASGARPRAQAPRREGRTDQTSSYQRDQTPSSVPPTSSNQQTQFSGSVRPTSSSQQSGQSPLFGQRATGGTPSFGCSRRMLVIVAIIAALFVCGYVALQCSGGLLEGGLGSLLTGTTDTGVETETETGGGVLYPTAAPATRVVATPVPTKPFVAPTRQATGGDNWLVMLYQDADDKTLERDIYIDLNEAEKIGSSDNVQIVTQIDRFTGGYTGDGNWTGTKRYLVTKDNDLNSVGSQLISDVGESNMADGNTLVDFATWAIQTFPADKYVLIMSDHGMGWPGGWSDPSHRAGNATTALEGALGNQLFLNELDAALGTIRNNTGIDKFELFGMDACLMGQLEVYSALEPHARYAVASEETEPALGWAYAGFLEALQRDPGMSGGELGQLIVDSYIDKDERIVDEEARAELVSQGQPMSSLFGYAIPSGDQVASQMGQAVTLSAIDLSRVPQLVESVNTLCASLQGANQRNVSQARSYAQSFTNIFGQQVPASYIDLGNFVKLLKQTNPGATVTAAADSVLGALQSAVIAEKHGSGKPGATGVAIYFPNSTLYKTPATGLASYTTIANRFATDSLWDDFLTYHYTGRTFDATAREAVTDAPGATVASPSAGGVQLSAVTASSTVAAPGNPVLLSADVSGDNLGYMMLFAGYYDSQSNSLLVADMDYLESADTREVDGVYYPVWPEGGFTLEFEWEPLVFYITDGQSAVMALLTPASYGATAEEAVYTVDGVYTYSTGEQLYGRLYFQDGQLRQVFGFTDTASASAPREIHPSSGDQFTVLQSWLDFDAQGQVVKRSYQQGETLTFTNQMFSWIEYDAAAGDYIVGFVAQDLDGNKQESYQRVTVQ